MNKPHQLILLDDERPKGEIAKIFDEICLDNVHHITKSLLTYSISPKKK